MPRKHPDSTVSNSSRATADRESDDTQVTCARRSSACAAAQSARCWRRPSRRMPQNWPPVFRGWSRSY